MQCAIIALGPFQFLAQALSVFGLSKFFKFETEKGADFHEEQTRVIAEEFLKLLIALATDRSKIGYTEEELIRREIVHRLCAGASLLCLSPPYCLFAGKLSFSHPPI